MSEHEFDAYLALLSGMLGLSRAQRESIAGELRDHMIERMHALVAAGVPQDEATKRALFMSALRMTKADQREAGRTGLPLVALAH